MNVIRDQRGAAMYNVLLGALVSVGIGAGVTAMSGGTFGEEGFDMSNPTGGAIQSRVYQGKAMADMQAMGKAITGFYLSAGRYPEDLQEFLATPYGEGMEPNDPWGSPWAYRADSRHFVLLSYGSDGARGPKPPQGWDGTETDPDLIIKDGAWLQVPERDIKLKAVKESVDKQRKHADRTQRAMENAGAQ